VRASKKPYRGKVEGGAKQPKEGGVFFSGSGKRRTTRKKTEHDVKNKRKKDERYSIKKERG